MALPEAPLIGIFDSGIGGLSVLRTLRQKLPQADIRYLADTRYTPWGDRSAAWVAARSLQLSAYLIDAGADLVLVACNTASTLAIAALRARWPERLFVAVEPGIKPAAATSQSGRIAVLGTSATLNSARFGHLVEAHALDTTLLRLPCPGLADAIERMGASPFADQQLEARLDALASTLKDAGVDTVVLACTHYPLVTQALAQRLGPGVALLDTADAVVQQVLRLLGRHSTASPADLSSTQRLCLPRLLSTGSPEGLQRAARRWIDPVAKADWLDLPDLA
jgi:glutamate racemase